MTSTLRARRLRLVTLGAVVLLAITVAGSLLIGARSVSPAVVWQALTAFDPTVADHVVVVGQRIPRTAVGLIAGAALALAGTLMQGLTRNPLADPGLLGINAGASVAVLVAITFFGISQPSGFVWFAFVGAGVAAVVVAVIGTRGPDGDNPAKLALTGAAVTAGLIAVTTFMLTTSAATLDVYRYWQVGGLTTRGLDTVAIAALPVAVGAVIALSSARGLDLLSLGSDTAAGLGQNVPRTRALGIVASVLLCGGATALAGPIVFVGLLVPHVLRALVGVGHGPLLALSIPVGASLLLAADVIGRVIALPGEVQAGIVVAFVGAPALIALVLRGRRVAL
ncbi:FecCD family ABC transporter permease [Microbacterium hatanonis]|jgi:iron complex transport system permease protein|uniref:Iron chelate uptake ABC transporter family permease subunit n=1 Tax=Microbacterium hatanonis TaxID=404366 RepID=A0A5C8I1M8_9MICO|nr:iron chelate uptake ABC transporter family permease subunit [Microbacterium hatanonis]TXK12912.1 iron chelate uptake ABC transporter family permease subunit [Microbacterium hatanonis]